MEDTKIMSQIPTVKKLEAGEQSDVQSGKPEVAEPLPYPEQQWEKVKTKLLALEEEAKKSAGQPDCNPFLWINKNIAPLRVVLTTNPNDKDALAKLAALKVPAKPNAGGVIKIPEAKQVEKLVEKPVVGAK